MSLVELGLGLDLNPFLSKLATAEGALKRIQVQGQAGVTIGARLDTSSIWPSLEAVKKTLAKEKVTLKVATEFYRVGSGNSISAKSLKEGVLKNVQQTVNGSDDYKIKIGTTFKFDQGTTRQIKSLIKELDASIERFNTAKVAAATSKPADVGSVRQRLVDLATNSEARGGVNPAELRRLQNEASKVGIKTSSTGARELRKELADEFLKAGEDAIKGLAKGLAENPSSVLRAGSKLVDTVIKGLKDDLGIRSPSKKTRDEIGKPMADGIGKGFVDGMVTWERRMAASIRQSLANAVQQGLARDQAARGALMNFGKDAGATVATSLSKALKQGLASSITPAIKGGLVGGVGGFATGGLVGAATAAGGAIKQAAMPAITAFGSAGMPEKLGMLGKGSASLVSGQASEAFNQFIQSSLDSVMSAALSSGAQDALLGAAGVAGVAGLAGLAKGASGSLVSQAVESIKNRILGTAAQEAQAQAALPGSTAGAVTAPIENAGNLMGLLKDAITKAARDIAEFAKNIRPGEINQRALNFAWWLDQAAGQFAAIKKDTQLLSGKIKQAWATVDGSSTQLLQPKPVPGTGLIREQNLQLGSVSGRTSVDFRRPNAYGKTGGLIGPEEAANSDPNFLGAWLDKERKGLQTVRQAFSGNVSEWRIVDEVNGVWKRIKTDSELAAERMAQIRKAITGSGSWVNIGQLSNRSDREGPVTSTFTSYTGNVGSFNPFDPAFYRGPRSAANYSMGGDSIPNARVTLGGTFAGSRRNPYDGKNGNPPSPPNTPFRRATQEAPGALALRNAPVEFFTSFRDAEKLLAIVEQRLANVAKAFGRLGVASQIQVDQSIRSLDASVRAVLLSLRKGEVTASDARAALYGYNRELAGLGVKSAEVQNLAQAFENLGIQSRAAVEALQDQRNIDLKFIESTLGSGSSEATRARNARDIQQLGRANELVRTAQGASGFGGFRGREIGNDILNSAEQRSVLANAIREMQEYQSTLKLTETNAKTFQRVQAALNQEIVNAERAFAVLNGTAKAGETITNVARNAWGTILDDFKNLVPQLLVFAVAYNLIIQRVLATPGAVIQASAAFDKLETSISSYLSATRGIGDATGEIDKLRSIALDLGIGFEKAASSYLRFAAATQETPLQGQEADITRTLATAGRNQGLSGEQIDRASVALTQILSKGRVQSEELRGQLAEQLPGALQVAARAFGVTTRELYRMVEAGQIAGDEFVGKFTQQLKAEGATVNQLAGSFSNVSEQLGSSIQGLTAASGKPFLAPLTVALQGLNGVIQALIPAAPVLTGLFVVLGADALRGALGVKSLTAEVIGAARALFVAKDPAEGYTAGLVKLTGVARVAASVLGTLGKAALIGFAFEAISGTIKYLKGEIGSLGDELKKVQKIADGGIGQGLNGLQKFFGNLNVAQNFSDSTTFFDSVKIGESSEKATKKIIGNQDKIASSLRKVAQIDKALYDERIRRDKAEANKDEAGANRSIQRIKKLEEERKSVKFEFSPEDAQIQLGALKAAEQAVGKLIERQQALGNSPVVEQKQLDRLRQTREEFEKTANAAGLLDKAFLRVKSLGALESQLKANQEILSIPDVNSGAFRAQQLTTVGLQQALTDQRLLPQERALKTQEAVLRRMSAELKVQENIQRIKLGLVENERRVLEASLSLEQTRGRLREVVAQRRVDVANAVGAPEDAMAGEAQLARIRERNQTRELQMQSQILSKDRERVGIETNLQKEQIRLQTQQIRIDKQMLEIERLKLVAASKTKGISDDLHKAYTQQLLQITKTINATDTLVGQEGQLLQSVEQSGAAQLNALGIKQQELDVQLELLGATKLTEQQVRQINAAKQDIANKEAAALVTAEAANKALERQQQAIESQLEVVRVTVDAERERSRLAEENAKAEMGLVDRLLELQQGRNDGGFFERLAKTSLLGASGEQDAYDLAQRRMELLRQVQEQQLRQKRLELNLKKQELEAEKALNDLKLKGLRIANEEAKISLRKKLEEARLTLVTLGDQASPEQKKLLSEVLGAQKALGGFNTEGKGNSVDVNIQSLVSQSNDLANSGKIIADMESNQNKVYNERSVALDNLISNEERMLDIQKQLFELDAAQWFGQFLDKSTQLGRTLGVITDGLSEFRSTVSQAFADSIVNGSSVSDAIGNAGKAFTGKIVTSLVDEAILKPMEANLFQGLSQVFGFKTPQSDQAATATNTGETKQSVDTVNSSVVTLTDVTRTGLAAVEQAIQGIAKPSMATPTYRQPENPGLTGIGNAIGGAVSTLGGVNGAFDTGLRTAPTSRNGGSAEYHQDLMFGSSVSMADRVKYFDAIAKAYEAQGRVIEFSNKAVQNLRYYSSMPFDQKADLLRRAQQAHANRPGGSGRPAIDYYAPIATQRGPTGSDRFSNSVVGQSMLAPVISGASYDYGKGGRYGSNVRAYKNGQMIFELGHGDTARPLPPDTTAPRILGPQSSSTIGDQFTRLLAMEGGLATVASAGAVPAQVVNGSAGSTRGWSGQSFPIPGSPLVPEPAPLPPSVPGKPVGLQAIPLQPAQAASATQPAAASTSVYEAEMLKLNDSVMAFTSTINLSDDQFTSLWQSADELKAGFESTAVIAQKTPSKLESLSNTIGGVAQILGSVAMGVAGFQQIKKGGTYNTLMGLAGIFGSLGSVTGFFAKGGLGSMFRASGGPVKARKPYIVGEQGPELFLPKADGGILSNPDTMQLFSGTRQSLKAQQAASASLPAPVLSMESMQPIDVRYEAQIINNVEYVTAEQHRKGMQEAARRGQMLAYQGMQHSVKVRRRLGM